MKSKSRKTINKHKKSKRKVTLQSIKNYLIKRNNRNKVSIVSEGNKSMLRRSRKSKSARKNSRKSISNKSVNKTKEKFYCGNKKKSPKGYSRSGSRYECMRKGFGAGSYSERNKILEYLKA